MLPLATKLLRFSPVAATAVLVMGCLSVATPTTGPGSSLPASIAVPSGAIPSIEVPSFEIPSFEIPSIDVPTPPTTETPTDTPTTAPTDTPTTPPTDNPHPDWPAGAVAARDAAGHVGETLTVCGNVAGANWLFDKHGHPTWLNFGDAYPNQNFNAVIWGEQRRQWPLASKPEVIYPGHQICVTGMIQMYKTWPQIQDLEISDFQVIN